MKLGPNWAYIEGLLYSEIEVHEFYYSRIANSREWSRRVKVWQTVYAELQRKIPLDQLSRKEAHVLRYFWAIVIKAGEWLASLAYDPAPEDEAQLNLIEQLLTDAYELLGRIKAQ